MVTRRLRAGASREASQHGGEGEEEAQEGMEGEGP